MSVWILRRLDRPQPSSLRTRCARASRRLAQATAGSPVGRAQRIPTFYVFSSAWLHAKLTGVLGDRPIDTNTDGDYRWRLGRHLLPLFGEYRLTEIDPALCLAFRPTSSNTRPRSATRSRLRSPPGADRSLAASPWASVDPQVDRLPRGDLDEAVEDGHLDRNPARGRRMNSWGAAVHLFVP